VIEVGTLVEVLHQHRLTKIYGRYAEVARLVVAGRSNRWLVKFFPRKKRHKPHFSEIYEFQLRELSPLEQLAGSITCADVRVTGIDDP
jgi:hypothetical protein